MHRPVLWLMPTWITQGVTAHGDDKCAASLASVQSHCHWVYCCGAPLLRIAALHDRPGMNNDPSADEDNAQSR